MTEFDRIVYKRVTVSLRVGITRENRPEMFKKE